MWLGRSIKGTSSGLHHDFQDNLYMLLQGEKRFTLFPPEDYSNLYLHGSVMGISSNGSLMYDDDLDDSEGEPESPPDSASEITYNSDVNDVEQDDYEVSEDEFFDFAENNPKSFSQIPSGVLHSFMHNRGYVDYVKISNNFDDYHKLKNTSPQSIILRQNEMLYLPAFWFHEVSSFSRKHSSHTNFIDEMHCAINYWFAPPDNQILHKKLYVDSTHQEIMNDTIASIPINLLASKKRKRTEAVSNLTNFNKAA